MSRSRARASLLAVLILALSVPEVVGAAQPAAGSRGATAGASPAATLRKVAIGVSQSPDTSLAGLDAFTAAVGRAPAVWSLWSAWGGASAPFPDTALMDGLRERRVVPQIFWEPVDPSIPAQIDDPTYSYRRINEGEHDAYIREWARAAKAWGGRILLKPAHEMNADWFPWGIGRNGNTVRGFRRAWRRIHDLMRGPGGEGATNVKLVWSVYGTCAGCPTLSSLYPGDDWVQYVGFSDFDWDDDKSMGRVLGAPVRALMSITTKRIVVTETGTPPTKKGSWIRNGYPAVYESFPRIAVIVYFDVRVPGQPDWRLSQPSGALTAYAAIAADPRFQGRVR